MFSDADSLKYALIAQGEILKIGLGHLYHLCSVVKYK